MAPTSRRQFLVAATSTTSAALLLAPLRAFALTSETAEGVSVAIERLATGWEFRRGSLDGIWEVWRGEESTLWSGVPMPHCFNALDACDPDVLYYRGEGWYRTRLKIANPISGGRTLLHFQGAAQTTAVWVGSTLVGRHIGGYDEFSFDITDALAALKPAESKGGLPVAVKCDNLPDLDRSPSDLSDFCLFGGLFRHVNLVHVPALSVESVQLLPEVTLTPGAAAQARVELKARLYNPSHIDAPCTVDIAVTSPTGESVFSKSMTLATWAEHKTLTTFDVPVAKLWSPETPVLYRCRITVSAGAGAGAQTGSARSTFEQRFGLRHTEFVEHGPFKLNGQRVFLRGTHRHQDHAGVAGGMDDATVRAEFALIKAMGVNFIRLAHYQQDRLVLDLCDELGIMVWEEAPWCREGNAGPIFAEQTHGMLRHMIEQHINHPAIILWGLGNEDDWPDEYPAVDQQAIRAFMTGMRDLAHSLDRTRLTTLRRCDFARDIPDVYSPSIWAGWYRGNYREYQASLEKERGRVKRLIHVEWGADSHATRHAEDPEAMLRKIVEGKGTDERGLDYLKSGGDIRMSSDGDWSETYACNLFDWYLKTQETMDWFTGSAMWIFKDFASPLRLDNALPNVNQKGVVERDLTRKEGYFVFQSYWTEKPMARIYSHTWPVRWGKPGEQKLVKVYSNCAQAELFLNGRSQGIKHRDSQDFPAAGLRWMVAFAAGKNHLKVVAKKGSAEVIDEVDLVYQTEPWGKPAELRLVELRREDGRVTAEAKVFDAKGIQCLDAKTYVRFSIAGDATLVQNLGTITGSHALQLANGRITANVHLKPGTSMLGVSADGVTPAFLKLSL